MMIPFSRFLSVLRFASPARPSALVGSWSLLRPLWLPSRMELALLYPLSLVLTQPV